MNHWTNAIEIVEWNRKNIHNKSIIQHKIERQKKKKTTRQMEAICINMVEIRYKNRSWHLKPDCDEGSLCKQGTIAYCDPVYSNSTHHIMYYSMDTWRTHRAPRRDESVLSRIQTQTHKSIHTYIQQFVWMNTRISTQTSLAKCS